MLSFKSGNGKLQTRQDSKITSRGVHNKGVVPYYGQVPDISSLMINDHVVATASALRIHMNLAAIVTASLLFTLRSRTFTSLVPNSHTIDAPFSPAVPGSERGGGGGFYSDSGRLGLHTTKESEFN